LDTNRTPLHQSQGVVKLAALATGASPAWSPSPAVNGQLLSSRVASVVLAGGGSR
jgi:hypothetical protein